MNKKIRIIVVIFIVLLLLGMIFFPKIKALFITSDADMLQEGPSRGQQELVVNATVLRPQTLQNMFRTKGVLLPDEEVDLTFENSRLLNANVGRRNKFESATF
jgi:membrane fusion protein (multidrug efflux system)